MVTTRQSGFTIVLVLVLVAVLTVGLLAVIPVWETQVRRESEEELIFRGTQIVEAIRLYQKKSPGQIPASLEELYQKRFLRRLYRDPMTRDGLWDIIVQSARQAPRKAGGTTAAGSSQIMIVSEANLAAAGSVRVIGVVSRSTRPSIRIYNDQGTYDQWFFYLGQDPKTVPEVIYLDGRDKK
jgi:type II secretory pathway pseudopilin PulG